MDAVLDNTDIVIEEAAIEPGVRAQEDADDTLQIQEEDQLVEVRTEVLEAEEPPVMKPFEFGMAS